MVSVSLFSGLCALLPADGLPAMFLARMKVLKTIRLREGKAGACIRFELLDER
jgi:hypothetical protein